MPSQYGLQYLPLFWDDLERAVFYVRNVLKNPTAAKRLLNSTEEAMLEHAKASTIAQVYKTTWNRSLPYNWYAVDNYMVFFVVWATLWRFGASSTAHATLPRCCLDATRPNVLQRWAMDFVIRHITEEERPLLEDFLYEAIFVPVGFEGEVPRSIIYDDPKCRAAYEGFGTLADDRAVVAEVDGEVVGACWVRTTDEYGHIDDATPSFSISLYGPYRGRGLGTAMMSALLNELRDAGYARVSLSVQKENTALRLYERMGFRIVGDGFDETEWLMVCRLDSATSLEVRRLEHDDLPDFVEMRIVQLREEGAQETVDLHPALNDYYRRHLADNTFVSWVAFVGDRMVATSGISIVEKPPYYGCTTGRLGLVSGMYTEPAWRRQGVARDLLCRVVEEARAQGCGAVHITASDAGVPLYRSVGFVRNANFLQLTL